MNEVLRDLVQRSGGLVTRAMAAQVVPSWTLRYACATGHLVRVLPEVFAAPSLLSEEPGSAALPTLSRLHPALGHRAVCAWAGGRIVYLDMFAERERVKIELDGATTHGDPRQGEIDLRRDALLAAMGILVVRSAHRRLGHEPDEVRRA